MKPGGAAALLRLPQQKGTMRMYPEFIAIYAGLAVVLVLLIVILILQIIILKNGGSGGRRGSKKHPINSAQGAVVFCKSCAARYSATERVCPKCHTPR